MTSKIVLGTMRMSLEMRSRQHWVRLLADAYDLGVRRLHCSDEYSSYPLLCECLDRLRASRPDIAFSVVAKLAEPTFEVEEFGEARFFDRLDAYRSHLKLDSIETVQWMWRGLLDDHPRRCVSFRASERSISQTIERAREEGRLEHVYCFPYDPNFAMEAIESDCQDGLAVYRNPTEADYDDAIERCRQLGKGVMVIRPFAAGSSLQQSDPESLIRYSATLPQVTGIIVSCSTTEHLQQCVEAARYG